jgi:sulfur-oxidizing protein SoxA
MIKTHSIRYLATSSILTLSFLAISACTAVAENADQESGSGNFESTLESAESARKQASDANSEWRDTKKIMKEAKGAAGEGNEKKAMKLSNKAQAQGELGLQQTKDNAAYLKQVPEYNPSAKPSDDLKTLQGYFRKKFPDLPDEEFANGNYALDTAMRENWEAIEDFPPYEPFIEEGETLWGTAFKNGKGYANCFPEAGITNTYPRWDAKKAEVVTVPMDINACREQHGEKPLKYGKDEMLQVQSYMAFESRGKPTKVTVPENDPKALVAYNAGKKFYFSRRGQLNLACSQCHFATAGMKIRTNVLGPALGQTSHWPTYRSKWGEMGSLHRRYKGCNKQVRAKPFDFQSETYRNLEFFHTHMSNGIPINGPGTRM